MSDPTRSAIFSLNTLLLPDPLSRDEIKRQSDTLQRKKIKKKTTNDADRTSSGVQYVDIYVLLSTKMQHLKNYTHQDLFKTLLMFNRCFLNMMLTKLKTTKCVLLKNRSGKIFGGTE